MYLPKGTHRHTRDSVRHQSEKLATTQMPTNSRLDKQTGIYSSDGRTHSNEKEPTVVMLCART